MNIESLQKKLLTAARSAPADERVPYAFEKRVMARLQDLAATDPWAFWSRSLWRAALACIAVAFVCGLWGFRDVPVSQETQDLAAQLENSIYTSASAGIEELW